METPCFRLCNVDASGSYCEGCRRTLAEIAAWASMSTTERRRIMSELARRQPQARTG